MAKREKIKEKKYKSEEQQEIFRFVKILVFLILVIAIFYFATRIFVKKDLGTKEKETNVTEVNYNKMVFGTMLSKPDAYYVLAFSSDNNKANYYGALADKYSQDENALNIYFIDLEDSMNQKFVSENGKSNSKAKKVNELSVGELTLIKVDNGEIVKYLESVEDIKTELNIK